tara:strand:+ start:752 stop:1573 length:822 start_codon:yes stop_codon:yes gene_type:complete
MKHIKAIFKSIEKLLRWNQILKTTYKIEELSNILLPANNPSRYFFRITETKLIQPHKWLILSDGHPYEKTKIYESNLGKVFRCPFENHRPSYLEEIKLRTQIKKAEQTNEIQTGLGIPGNLESIEKYLEQKNHGKIQENKDEKENQEYKEASSRQTSSIKGKTNKEENRQGETIIQEEIRITKEELKPRIPGIISTIPNEFFTTHDGNEPQKRKEVKDKYPELYCNPEIDQNEKINYIEINKADLIEDDQEKINKAFKWITKNKEGDNKEEHS